VSEATIQSEFHRRIHLQFPRCIVIRQNSGSIRTSRGFIQLAPKGTPDTLVVCPEGVSLWFEAKSMEGQISQCQSDVHTRMRKLGHRVFVYRSVDEGISYLKSVLSAQRG
jgi:hypothetical protein